MKVISASIRKDSSWPYLGFSLYALNSIYTSSIDCGLEYQNGMPALKTWSWRFIGFSKLEIHLITILVHIFFPPRSIFVCKLNFDEWT